MSVRENDRQKNSCPSRGLGIAVAAIGVGVGAALYYMFSKETETPNTEGSTSNWTHGRPETFHQLTSDDSYTTISEHDTTDTSINSFDELSDIPDMSELTVSDSDDSSDITSTDSDMSMQYVGSSESENEDDWSMDFSQEDSLRSPIMQLSYNIESKYSPKKKMTEEEQMTIIRQQALAEEELKMNAIRQEAFRERSWTLEECSICFEVMLRSQDVTSLSCSHNFHTDCIMPWLQERQTCPNCRKVAE